MCHLVVAFGFESLWVQFLIFGVQEMGTPGSPWCPNGNPGVFHWAGAREWGMRGAALTLSVFQAAFPHPTCDVEPDLLIKNKK